MRGQMVIASVMGLLTLVLLAGLVYYLRTRYKDEEPGKVFNRWMIKYPSTWFWATMLLLVTAEGLTAASIEVQNEFMNPVARFVLHMTISAAQVLCAYIFPKYIRTFFGSFWAKPFDGGRTFVRGLVAMVAFAGLVGLPLYNTMMIAVGLGKMNELLALGQYIWHTREWYTSYCMVYGIDYTKNPFQQIGYVMVATVIVNVVHIGTIFLESAFAYLDPNNFDLYTEEYGPKTEKDKDQGKSGGSKDDGKKKGDASPKGSQDTWKKMVYEILAVFELKGTQADETYARFEANRDKLLTDDKVKVKFAKEISMYHGKLSADDFDKKKFVKEFNQFLSAGPAKGGISMQIPTKQMGN